MSDEREQAKVVSTYADDLVTRRRENGPSGPPETHDGLAEILDLARTVSAICIATPANFHDEMWRRMTAADEAERKARGRWPSWIRLHLLRPLSALGVVALSLVLWMVFQLRTPRVSAAELLKASARAEAIRLERPGLVAHRAFTLHARRLPESTLIARRRVELWANPRSRVKARRVFDERDRLLAGEWTNPDGSRVVYEAGKPPQRERATDAKPLTAETLWRWEPSASDFTALVVNLERIEAKATPAGYQLAFNGEQGRVAEAELALDKEHVPTAQRIVLRERSGALVEFRTTRSSADEIPESRVAHTTFDPEPELLPQPALPTLPPKPVSAPLFAVDQIELQASYRLHRMVGCLARPGELRRDAAGFRIGVVLASEECREAARPDLTALAETPGVSVDLSVAGSRSGNAAVASSTPVDAAAVKSIPVYPKLYDLFARQALREAQPGARDVDAAVAPLIAQFAQRTRERSGRALGYARELRRLTERWPPGALQRLGLDSAAMWRVMVRDHAQSLGQDCEVLLAQLQPVLGVAEPQQQDPVAPPRNLTDVRRSVGELESLVEHNDAAIRQLLAPSQAGASPDLKRLARDMQRSARLARLIAAPWSLEP